MEREKEQEFIEVRLPYGRKGMTLRAPKTPGFVGVLERKRVEPLADPAGEVERALAEPIESPGLAAIASKKVEAARRDGRPLRVCVVISDITRPVPNQLILPPMLATLEESGVKPGEITILIATGIHRPNEGDEMIELVGPDIQRRYRVVNHFSKRQEDLIEIGTIAGWIPVEINREYVESDLKILTGMIEPHMWAGYSGGRKAVLPGIASLRTMKFMHGFKMVGDKGCDPGRLEGNPFHEAGLDVLDMAGADFLLNVTVDDKRRLTGVFAGHPVRAHLDGCRFLEASCVIDVDGLLDFVVTTNGGHPLDINLYQSVKGVRLAAPVVREGGAILICSACWDGSGSEEYTRLIESAAGPREFVRRLSHPDFFVPDQWCAQDLFQIMITREVLLKNETLDLDWLAARGISPVTDADAAVEDLLRFFGRDARWAIIPEGPYVIPRPVAAAVATALE